MRKENSQRTSTRIKTALLAGFLFLISGASCAKTDENLPPACRNRYNLKTGDPTTADVIAIHPSVNTVVHCVIELLNKSTNRRNIAGFYSEDPLQIEELCSIMNMKGYECSKQKIRGSYRAYFLKTEKTEKGSLTTSQLGPNIYVLSETPRFIPGVKISTSILERKEGTQDNTITIKSANETMKSVM